MKICNVCGNEWKEESTIAYCRWCKSQAIAIEAPSDKENLIKLKAIPY